MEIKFINLSLDVHNTLQSYKKNKIVKVSIKYFIVNAPEIFVILILENN